MASASSLESSLARLAQRMAPVSIAGGRRANVLCFPVLKLDRSNRSEIRNLVFDLEGMRMLNLDQDTVHKSIAVNNIVGYQPFSHNSVVIKFSGIQRDYQVTVLYAADMSLLLDALSLCVTWIHAAVVEEASQAWASLSAMAYRDVMHMGWLLITSLSSSDPRSKNLFGRQTKMWCVVLPGRILCFRTDKDTLSRSAIPLVWIDDPNQLVIRSSETSIVVRSCGGQSHDVQLNVLPRHNEEGAMFEECDVWFRSLASALVHVRQRSFEVAKAVSVAPPKPVVPAPAPHAAHAAPPPPETAQRRGSFTYQISSFVPNGEGQSAMPPPPPPPVAAPAHSFGAQPPPGYPAGGQRRRSSFSQSSVDVAVRPGMAIPTLV